MRICSISDWHAESLDLVEICNEWNVDLIICTGDMLKNFAWADASVDVPKQSTWIKHNKLTVDKPVVCVRGNHDYVPIAPYFTGAKVFEFEETPAVVHHSIGVKIAGFRGTKMGPGSTWSDSMPEQEMANKINKLNSRDFEILITHGPGYNERDWLTSGEPIGSMAIGDWLRSGKSNALKLHLFGHIHESFGFGRPIDRNILSVNSATGFHIIERDDDGNYEVIHGATLYQY